VKLLILLLLFPFSAFATEIPKVCLVDPPAHEEDRYQPNRPCLNEDATPYAHAIREAVELYPKIVQDELRHVQRIEIEKQFFGAAWSDPVKDDVLIGLRKKELDEEIDLQTYLTRFERQTFGGQGPEVKISPERVSKLRPVALILLHELSHALDYRLNLQKTWAPLHREHIDSLHGVCLNQCKGKSLDPKEAARIYPALFQNAFVSQLASISSREDWAESFTFFVFVKKLGAEISISPDFSVNKLIESPAFSEKRKNIESVLN
jgi:hypothetical protein